MSYFSKYIFQIIVVFSLYIGLCIRILFAGHCYMSFKCHIQHFESLKQRQTKWRQYIRCQLEPISILATADANTGSLPSGFINYLPRVTCSQEDGRITRGTNQTAFYTVFFQLHPTTPKGAEGNVILQQRLKGKNMDFCSSFADRIVRLDNELTSLVDKFRFIMALYGTIYHNIKYHMCKCFGFFFITKLSVNTIY